MPFLPVMPFLPEPSLPSESAAGAKTFTMPFQLVSTPHPPHTHTHMAQFLKINHHDIAIRVDRTMHIRIIKR